VLRWRNSCGERFPECLREMFHLEQALGRIIDRQHARIFDSHAHEAGRLDLNQSPKMCSFLRAITRLTDHGHQSLSRSALFSFSQLPFQFVQPRDGVLGSMKRLQHDRIVL
jgi:hypothetical protein